MRRALLVLTALGLALAPALVHAAPPAADPHNSCVTPVGARGPFTLPPLAPVNTLSHLAPLGASLPCAAFVAAPGMPAGPYAPYTFEWGGHGPPCPPPPFVGAIPGAFCGPVVPPFGTATCSWIPILPSVPTGLVIGFDAMGPLPFLPGPGPLLPPSPGLVSFTLSGEVPVFGPFPSSVSSTLPPTGWTVPNPYVPGVFPGIPGPLPARVIAFPTDLSGVGAGAGDVSYVVC